MKLMNTKLGSAFLLLLSGIVAASTLTACVPEETPLPLSVNASSTPTPSRAYAGFTGATLAETTGANKVKLTWTPSTDPNVVAYTIYDVTDFYNPKAIRTVRVPASTVSLTGLATQALYSFRVRASNSANLEDTNKNDVQAIPYAGVLTGTATSSSTATLTFPDGSNSDQIDIYCKTDTSPTFVLTATVRNVLLTSVNLSGLASGSIYTCRTALEMGGFVDNNTTTVTFTPIGSATSLSFTTQPGSGTAGVAVVPQPIVQILDNNGNVVSAGPDSSALVSLSLATASPTLGTVRGTVSMPAVRGVADFTGKGINLRESGIKILTATKADTSSLTNGSGPLSADSASFTIAPDTVSATLSTMTLTPVGPALVADGAASYTATISLKDQYGNPIAGVKPIIASTDAGDTLTQPSVVTNAAGTVTGAIKTIIAGTKTLSITSPAGLGAVTATAQFVPGPATKVAFQMQPANSPAGPGAMNEIKVMIQDAKGNVVTSGASSTASVSVSIFTNPGGGALSGTATLSAVGGIADFVGLGIDKTGTGYKLVANSPTLSTSLSNAFNITAGVPSKLAVNGPSTVISGACSTAFTVAFQDYAGNPANATANTTITLSGLGSATLYSSSTCTGTPLTTSMTFASGSNIKTVYLKDNHGESLTFTANDPSTVMTLSTKVVNILPNGIALTSPATAISGKCSSSFTITSTGNDGLAAKVAASTSIQITGLAGTSGALFAATDCSGTPVGSTVSLAATTSSTTLYLLDPKAEALSLTVSDPAAVMGTTSSLQNTNVLASVINFTGPATVVSGQCSTAFSVKLRDSAGNNVNAPANKTLTLNGIGGSQGAYYASSACTGAPLGTTLIIPANASSATIYFKDLASENFTLSVSDPSTDLTVKLDPSAALSFKVSPSALVMTGPASVKTSLCAGPFTLTAQDGAGNPANVLSAITVALGGGGSGGTFTSDSACSTPITQVVFSVGTNTQQFYFTSLAAATSPTLTLTGTDAGSVLSQATLGFTVLPARAWIGSKGVFQWFQTGGVPMVPKFDNLAGTTRSIHFDSTKTYLYIADWNGGRVHKFQYATGAYVGWIGTIGGGVMTGSNVNGTIASQCIAASYATPGWCTGGYAGNDGNGQGGRMSNPWGLTDDGTHLYVANYNGHTIQRFNLVTGAFEGWIGRPSAQPTGPGTPDLTNTCSTMPLNTTTPGWCKGGTTTYAFNAGNGTMVYPRALTYSGGFLYVAQGNSINRYDAATGAFKGWVGRVYSSQPTGPAFDVSNACASTAVNAYTPGWCMGGGNQGGDVRSGAIQNINGLWADSTQNILFVASSDYGSIMKYSLSSGAFLGVLFQSIGLSGVNSITTDGTTFYIADSTRLSKVDISSGILTGWIGKVSTSPVAGNAGCSGRASNTMTPGWCAGGSARNGLDEGAFTNLAAIEMDGNGNLITGEVSNSFNRLQKFNLATGVYQGQAAWIGSSPARWTTAMNDADSQGFDDNSLANPTGITQDGTYIFVAESGSGRIKKILKSTGQTTGWIGGMITTPQGGDAACIGATPNTFTPGWCLKTIPVPRSPDDLFNNLIPQTVSGLMPRPSGLASDGTYLYVTDWDWHRISKYKIADGSLVGWIGGISQTPASGCTGVAGQFSGTGWCVGGLAAASGSDDGYMNNPGGIYYNAGYLYVADRQNHRISRFSAVNGTFAGWKGKVQTGYPPTSGCTVNGSNYPTTGWCIGGRSVGAGTGTSAAGGFQFEWTPNITGSGNYIYVSNFWNSRVDKFDLNGNFIGALRIRMDIANLIWSSTVTWGWEGWYQTSLSTDGTSLYIGGDGPFVQKRALGTGALVGWKGAISGTNSPTGGDPGCAGATGTTPGWCLGGTWIASTTMDGFTSTAYSVSDGDYLYVTDGSNQRITRLVK